MVGVIEAGEWYPGVEGVSIPGMCSSHVLEADTVTLLTMTPRPVWLVDRQPAVRLVVHVCPTKARERQADLSTAVCSRVRNYRYVTFDSLTCFWHRGKALGGSSAVSELENCGLSNDLTTFCSS